MSNMKVIYDCEKKTTSYVPLSGAEIAEREAQAAAYAAEQAAKEAAALEAPVVEETPAVEEVPAEQLMIYFLAYLGFICGLIIGYIYGRSK